MNTGSMFHRGTDYLDDPLASEIDMSTDILVRQIGGNNIYGETGGVPLIVPTVDDLTALQVLSIPDGTMILALGYSSAGDGAGGWFKYSAASVATANGGTVLAPDIGPGRFLRSWSGAINVKWFGARGDGATDDTSAIQSAIDAAQRAGGGSVYLPAGDYLVSDTLEVTASGVAIVGAGMWVTNIVRASDYGDTIFATGDDATGSVIQGFGLSRLGIKSSALTTSGAHIHINGVFRGEITSVYLEHGFRGILLEAATSFFISNIEAIMDSIYGGSATNRAFFYARAASSNYSHPASGDVLISDFNFAGNNDVIEHGISISSGDGIWFNNGHVRGAATALVDIQANGDQLTFLEFNNVIVDANTSTYGIYLEGSGGRGRWIQFNNMQVAGNSGGGIGIIFKAGSQWSDVTFNGVDVIQWKFNGVELNTGGMYNTIFSGCYVENNNTSNTAGKHGLVAAAGVGSFSIIGGHFGGIDATICKQGYGIVLVIGAGNNILISGVDTTFNTTAGIQSFATGDNVHISACFDGSTNTVASANAIDVPLSGDVVIVSGTTNISSITALGRGQKVVLLFEGILTVQDGVGNLKLNGDFTTSADDTLTLVCDGTTWFEVARSAN